MSECNHMTAPIGYSDAYVKLAQHRVIIISEEITDILSAQLSALLLYYDNKDSEDFITIYIHSLGGASSALRNIYDVMQMIKSPIKTICLGRCYSAAAVILSAGTKGHRYAMKNSSIMIHGIQLEFPIPGDFISSSKAFFNSVKFDNDSIMKILSHHTGQPLEKIKSDCLQDIYLSAKDSIKYGLIDHII